MVYTQLFLGLLLVVLTFWYQRRCVNQRSHVVDPHFEKLMTKRVHSYDRGQQDDEVHVSVRLAHMLRARYPRLCAHYTEPDYRAMVAHAADILEEERRNKQRVAAFNKTPQEPRRNDDGVLLPKVVRYYIPEDDFVGFSDVRLCDVYDICEVAARLAFRETNDGMSHKGYWNQYSVQDDCMRRRIMRRYGNGFDHPLSQFVDLKVGEPLH
jgi:hypothetical protein